MSSIRLLVAIWVSLLSALAFAQSCRAEENDIVLKSLEDELKRSVDRLSLPPHSPPYFVEYTLNESDNLSISASLGALFTQTRRRGRNFYPVVRVGSYKMDDSNFTNSLISYNSPDDFAPVDDSYFALRRVLWLLTDYGYKQAVQSLEEKKAYLLEKNATEEIDDFSRQEPLTWLKPTKRLSIDQDEYVERTKRLSNVFREYPSLFDSSVDFFSYTANTWLANNEGTRIRYGDEYSRYVLFASTKTREGLSVFDWEILQAHDRAELPSEALLEGKIRELARRVEEVSRAPLIEDYEGPVLLEGSAAAEFFAQGLSPNMVASRANINDVSVDLFSSNPLVKKLGKRVMPTFISVIDDPVVKRFQGVDLFGGAEVDDEGVKPQRVVLVENGILKTLCSNRTPIKEIRASNGHGVQGVNAPATSCLFIQSTNQLRKKALYDQLKKLGKEAGLDHVYVVRRLANPSRYSHGSDVFNSIGMSLPGSISLSNPFLIYKISLSDGKETLVRGARFVPAHLRVLKDIVATGADTAPHLCETTYSVAKHVVSPSILIRELEIEKVNLDEIKPPVLENPLLETK